MEDKIEIKCAAIDASELEKGMTVCFKYKDKVYVGLVKEVSKETCTFDLPTERGFRGNIRTFETELVKEILLPQAP